ncbi:MAG: hypothetical protein ACPH9D_00785 [Candidatus Puniceispirillaceae bacterium]
MRHSVVVGMVFFAIIGIGIVFLSNWHIPAPSVEISKTLPDSRFAN